MLSKENKSRMIALLENGIGRVRDFDDCFVHYNTRYLGCSMSNDFIINGESIKNSRELNEFCYAYDGKYHQIQVLSIYEMLSGKKYAVTEIFTGGYAFWEILD